MPQFFCLTIYGIVLGIVSLLHGLEATLSMISTESRSPAQFPPPWQWIFSHNEGQSRRLTCVVWVVFNASVPG